MNENQFVLQGTGDNFKGRSGDVFGSLDVIEAKHSAVQQTQQKSKSNSEQSISPVHNLHDVIDDKQIGEIDERASTCTSRRRKNTTLQFKRPKLPPPRNRKADHAVHPKKWTFYDLSDVDSSSMSEKANRSSALNFINDLKKRQHARVSQDSPADSEETFQVKFKKPNQSRNELTNDKEFEDGDKSKYISGKLVMPEYSIGSKGKSSGKGKDKKSNKQTASGIKLQHLDDVPDSDEYVDIKDSSAQSNDSDNENGKTAERREDEGKRENTDLINQMTGDLSEEQFKKTNKTSKQIRKKIKE